RCLRRMPCQTKKLRVFTQAERQTKEEKQAYAAARRTHPCNKVFKKGVALASQKYTQFRSKN
ncbi:hypothetical protein, partial [Desulfovibrio cuneatus]|uniref:hypothetical protein n=1 Tax=Desulfovibrio cuneatus TaxID=159728 RepID=UPI0005578D47